MNAHTNVAQSDPTALGALIESWLRDAPLPDRDEQIEAVYAIGHAYYAREDFQRAADVFRLMVLTRPQEARGWTALAACHDAVDEEEQAEALYEAALLAPIGDVDRDRARVFLARLLASQGRISEAREHLDAVEGIDHVDVLEAEIATLRRSLGGRR
jgi:tetratricopeptide (TPR) repeat protein